MSRNFSRADGNLCFFAEESSRSGDIAHRLFLGGDADPYANADADTDAVTDPNADAVADPDPEAEAHVRRLPPVIGLQSETIVVTPRRPRRPKRRALSRAARLPSAALFRKMFTRTLHPNAKHSRR